MWNNVKRLLVIAVTMFVTVVSFADELRFVYIAHDTETSTDKLVKELQGLYKGARNGVPSIFYLSDGESPKVAYFNINGRQDADIYREIVAGLQESNFHNTSASVDRANITRMFTELNPDGQYDLVDWKFYITQNYWNMYRESIIASTYFILGIDTWKTSFLLQLYYSGSKPFKVDKVRPFGELDLCPSINHGYELVTL